MATKSIQPKHIRGSSRKTLETNKENKTTPITTLKVVPTLFDEKSKTILNTRSAF